MGGAATFLFTDIQGSTKLLQELGDGYTDLLSRHHSVVRAATDAHNGREVDNAGDGFFLAFDEAADAIGTALEIQLALRDHPRLFVRMGIHSGSAKRVGNDYVGLAVHHAARVSAAAHGGQVLVTDEARIEVTDVTYIDLGMHRLKDLAEPIRIWQLDHEQLPHGFPPVRSLGVGGGNLPRPRTTFIGREDEVADIGTALSAGGLTTLTGPGGCGKTRLAIEAARAHGERFAGGTWFVELQAVADGADVLWSVARALGVPDATEEMLLSHVIARLGADPTILILDTCEHLVDACAEISDQLLTECPELRIIATSRELLGLPDEAARRVPSLQAEGSAAELFVERARRRDAKFADDPAVIGRICERLDGIPLAIELAAARTRHMSLTELESRLDDRFRVLTGSERRTLERHQTLEALVGWSYDLLSDEEARVLRFVAAFAATFTADDALAVADTDEGTIYRLVDRSLVEVVGDGRLHLLETVRLFAQQRLHDARESDAARGRHLAWVIEVAERAAVDSRGDRYLEALAAFDAVAADVKSSLEWAVRVDRRSDAARLGTAAAWVAGLASSRGTLVELIESLADVDVDLETKARLELGLAMMRYQQNKPTQDDFGARAHNHFLEAHLTDDNLFGWAVLADAITKAYSAHPDSVPAAEHAIEIATRRGDDVLAAYGHGIVAWAHMFHARLDDARDAVKVAREIGKRTGNAFIDGITAFWSGLMAMHASAWAEASRHYGEALPVFRSMGHKIPLQWTLDHMSQAALSLEDFESARAYVEEGIALSREFGLATGGSNFPNLLETGAVLERWFAAHAQAAMYLSEAVDILRKVDRPLDLTRMIARLAAEQAVLGDLDDAMRWAREALDLMPTLTSRVAASAARIDPPTSTVLHSVARVLLATGDARTAAAIYGAALALDEAKGITRYVPPSRLPDDLRSALGNSFEELVGDGRSLGDPLELASRTLG